MRVVRACLLLLATALAFRTVLAQQQSSVLSETEDGRQLFLANCAVCHGPDGDSVYGVDLGHGKFKTASSDDDLIQDRKSTRLNSSHQIISYAVFCLKKKKIIKSQSA